MAIDSPQQLTFQLLSQKSEVEKRVSNQSHCYAAYNRLVKALEELFLARQCGAKWFIYLHAFSKSVLANHRNPIIHIYGYLWMKFLKRSMSVLALTAPVIPTTIKEQDKSPSTSKNLSLKQIRGNNMPFYFFQSILKKGLL